ncbi:PAS domain-containing protein [Desulfobacterales bacterium HSG16]|nr:PAS domain-containing protein [Desulfobacterales bacterium HSG16]
MKLDNISQFRFYAVIDGRWKGEEELVDISLLDFPERLKNDQKAFEVFAKILLLKYINVTSNGGLVIPSGTKKINSYLSIELERFEEEIRIRGDVRQNYYNLILRICNDAADTVPFLKQKIRGLEDQNRLLQIEVKKLIEMLEKVEMIKESFRIPFDAIEDLLISFDKDGNVLVVNEASREWFGQSPSNIVRKRYKTILKQDILYTIRQVSDSKKPLIIEETIDDRLLQISYIPTTNRKNGQMEVVMVVQDVTKRKLAKDEGLLRGRNEGVSIMGGTIRHILNSSLNAILGFAQLALSSYEWPKSTMIKYLKLIERTALRMKNEIASIADQKEYRITNYIDVPETRLSSFFMLTEFIGNFYIKDFICLSINSMAYS